MAADTKGNVYCTEGITNIIGIFSPDRKYRTFVQDKILNYPYGLAISSDQQYLYISVNQVHRLKEKSHTTVDPKLPFLITRARLL
jgi:hypothetical protein